MVKSPLSDLTGDNSVKIKEKETKKKDRKFKNSFNNAILKEISPFLIWTSITVTAVGGSLYYTNVQEKEYALSNYSKVTELTALETQVSNSAKEVGASQATLENATNKVAELTSDLSEQGKVKSPLSQGYYFVSYLSYLSTKYEVDLKKLDVLASDGQSEIDLTKVADAKGTFDLLPISVELTATSENLRKLFQEIYTKRIILIKDIEITNHLDSTVTAKFRVFFREINFQTDEYGQIVTDPNTGAPMVQEQMQDPNQPPVDGAPPIDGAPPVEEDLGMEGEVPDESNIIDPITGLPVE